MLSHERFQVVGAHIAPLPPSAHTLRVEGVCSRRGAQAGGISPFFISLAPIQTDVSFYSELPENRSFLSIVSLGRPPGVRSME